MGPGGDGMSGGSDLPLLDRPPSAVAVGALEVPRDGIPTPYVSNNEFPARWRDPTLAS